VVAYSFELCAFCWYYCIRFLQRNLFLPFIALLKELLDVGSFAASRTDYRLVKCLSQAEDTYFLSNGGMSKQEIASSPSSSSPAEAAGAAVAAAANFENLWNKLRNGNLSYFSFAFQFVSLLVFRQLSIFYDRSLLLFRGIIVVWSTPYPLLACFSTSLKTGKPEAVVTLRTQGRAVVVPRAVLGTRLARFTFQQLCGTVRFIKQSINQSMMQSTIRALVQSINCSIN